LEEYCIFCVAPPKTDFTLGRLEAAAPSNLATLEPILMRDTLSNGTGPAARAANTVKRIAFAGMLRLKSPKLGLRDVGIILTFIYFRPRWNPLMGGVCRAEFHRAGPSIISQSYEAQRGKAESAYRHSVFGSTK